MSLHTDIPTRAQVLRLLEQRDPASVSIYLPTSRIPQEAQADRIELKNLAGEAEHQLQAAGIDRHHLDALREELDHLVDDDEFWARQANSLAVFATPDRISTFRLPNHLVPIVEVSDRFHVKPLLRTITFPQAAYVLALAQGSVRLLEIGPSGDPEEVHVPALPSDAWESRGNKVVKAREHGYARQVDHALRPVLGGHDLPLILAATETMAATYHSVNTYPHLVEARLTENPETTSDGELAAAARGVLDQLYADDLAELRERFEQLSAQGRTATDVSDVARLATYGAVDTLLVDMDEAVPGFVDEATGEVTFSTEDDAANYGVLDEVARRVLLSSGRVLAVRRDDVPGGNEAAALLRYVV